MKRMDWNDGWLFCRLSGTAEQKDGAAENGSVAENGSACPAGSPQPVPVRLPHDAMLHEARAADNPSGSAGAFFAGGEYRYEKRFFAPGEWRGKKLVLLFEGIYDTAEIDVNGRRAAQAVYGYAATEADIGPYLAFGAENTVTVTVHNQNQPNSRWYSGAGIFRPVWLYVLEPQGIALRGVRVRTLSCAPARVQVTTRHGGGTPRVTVYDGETPVAAGCGDSAELTIPAAKLWSAETPHLYRCHVALERDGKTVDEQSVSFGVRMLSWSPQGLFVNGAETLLRGACIHHDNGVLGACAYEEAEWRRVRILKENGFNAIRSAHNPCSEAMLAACDALGMYMMDETWDMWYSHKSRFDYAARFPEHYRDDLRALVERDCNHPSVLFYSIGNEVAEPASAKGLALEREMVELLHTLDDSRAVTAGFNLMILSNAAKGQLMYNADGGVNMDTAGAIGGGGAGEQDGSAAAAGKAPEDPGAGGMPPLSEMNSTLFNQIVQQVGTGMNHSADSDAADAATAPALALLDIAGYNYASGRYPLEGEKHPERVLFGSETFPQDIFANWEMVKKYPYLIGDFMWTGWDYLGEAGIGCWSCSPDAMGFSKPYPWLLGGAGVISILGDADGEALYNRVVWGLTQGPLLAVRPVCEPAAQLIRSAWRGTNAIPSWSWRGCEGQPAHVEVYGSGAEAAVLLNGAPLARGPLTACRCEFDVPYQPGVLEAVLFDAAGGVLGRTSLASATGAVSARVRLESAPENGRLVYANIDLCGENGVLESNGDTRVCVSVEGGVLLGLGSANPHTEEGFLSDCCTTFRGRAQAVVRVEDAARFAVHAALASPEGCAEPDLQPQPRR